MKLQTLAKNKFTVTAVIVKKGEDGCPLIDFLYDLPDKYQASVAGITAIMDEIAEKGLESLSTKQCHSVDKNNKIYEIIKGDIRVFFFKGHCDIIVVATHGIIKKSQKTPQREKDIAIRFKKQYQQAHDTNSITIIEES
ncbi:MAG: type II toxin-antitoxin system RelE/ParE family toxin [Methylobacter sp.]